MIKEIVELNDSQIDILFDFSQLNENDVFYDLGSGTGKVVVDAYKKRNVQKSIGIEYNKKYFDISKKRAKKELLREAFGKRVDFFHGNYSDKNENEYIFDISDATVVYNSLAPSDKSDFYDEQFGGISGIKIIKKDLPLVGFRPIKASRKDPDSPFFLMCTPLQKYRISSKNQWASFVLGKDAEISEVFSYYERLWEKNNDSKIPIKIKSQLENLVEIYLPRK